jgi:hypothetical protein
MFGLEDVRAPRDQVRGQAGGHVGHHVVIGERPGGGQILGNRCTQQQLQGIARLLQLPLVGLHVDLRGFDLAFGLAQIQLVAGAGIKSGLVEVVGGLHRASVSWESFSSSSVSRNVRYCVATSPTSDTCAARCASSVWKYCSRAWAFWLRTWPKRSSS